SDAEKVAHLTRPTLARRDALFLRQRSRIAQALNGEKEFLRGRKHCRGFSARQDPSQGRTAHTKCGLYPFGSLLAVALLDSVLSILLSWCPAAPHVHAIEAFVYKGS